MRALPCERQLRCNRRWAALPAPTFRQAPLAACRRFSLAGLPQPCSASPVSALLFVARPAMPAATAIGAALLAFGPPAVFFFGFIAPRSQLLIMSILAAFVWVVAITIAGVVWVAIPPLQEATALHLPVAVLFQVSPAAHRGPQRRQCCRRWRPQTRHAGVNFVP